MRTFKMIWLIFLALATTANARLFDDQRKGPILGGGLGLGITSYTEPWKPSGWMDFSLHLAVATSLQTDLKAGWGLDQQNEIFITSKISWFSEDFNSGYQSPSKDITVADGLLGIAVTHYFNSQPPSFFISGGIARATWSSPFDGEFLNSLDGTGFFLGIGHEIKRHYCIEIDLLYGNVDFPSYDASESIGSLTLRTVFIGTAY
ncbi:MAG: hypothetical protein A2W25_16120 [candidate division Zixibacteria bacterium RBG_16_53_22]|nr:MAG: hypothetical protein A2W25_16120 [candidate division Zixibacteria bacterium RBG_16_53_22]